MSPKMERPDPPWGRHVPEPPPPLPEDSAAHMTRVLSIDPGDVHNGVTTATLDPSRPMGGQLLVRWQGDWPRAKLIEELESYASSQHPRVDVVLIEKFVLYPWMAREQGYSEFPTVKVIGVVEYLVGLMGIPLIKTATSNKNEAVAVARYHQKTLLRSYPNRKKGKIYFQGNNEHERDALAHMVWFAWRDPRSPLYRKPNTDGYRTKVVPTRS